LTKLLYVQKTGIKFPNLKLFVSPVVSLQTEKGLAQRIQLAPDKDRNTPTTRPTLHLGVILRGKTY